MAWWSCDGGVWSSFVEGRSPCSPKKAKDVSKETSEIDMVIGRLVPAAKKEVRRPTAFSYEKRDVAAAGNSRELPVPPDHSHLWDENAFHAIDPDSAYWRPKSNAFSRMGESIVVSQTKKLERSYEKAMAAHAKSQYTPESATALRRKQGSLASTSEAQAYYCLNCMSYTFQDHIRCTTCTKVLQIFPQLTSEEQR